MFKLSKKIALPLIAVLLIGTGVGGYFLFRDFQIPKYFVDRYPELLDYCDLTEDANGLKVSCKALMLDLKPNDGSPSLSSLVITNSEELKEYTITEKEEMYSFTNDILQFKKLKPVIINIQYTKINPIKYAIQGITFEDIPETYIQEIVNRDIEEIMGMDKNSTTILNSFDFCPRPEILPDYVVKKDEYAKYWGENILSEEEYKNEGLYTTEDTVIRILFGCDSQTNLGYTNNCPQPNIELTSNLKQTISQSEPNAPEWGNKLDDINQAKLKQISLLYDNSNNLLLNYMPLLKNGEEFSVIKSTPDILQSLVETINSEKNVSEEVFCGTVKLLERYNLVPEIQEYIDKIKFLFLENISLSSSSICSDILIDNFLDQAGTYIKNAFTKNTGELGLFNSCINLQGFMK